MNKCIKKKKIYNKDVADCEAGVRSWAAKFAATSVLPGGMEMARRVLVVIDLLNDFLNPAGALYCGDGARKIIPVIRSLIDEFTAEGEPVVSQGCPR